MERGGRAGAAVRTAALRAVAGGTVLMALIAMSGQRSWAQPATDLAAYVDPFIGTGAAPTSNYGQEFDSGDVFPGAAYPTGMLAWSPDTLEHKLPGGYAYQDRT